MAKRKTTKKKTVTKRGECPRVSVLVGCDGASRDPASGKTTIYGVYETIYMPHLKMGTEIRGFATFRGGSGKHNISFALRDSKGNEYKADTPGIDIKCGKTKSFSIIIALSNVPIKRKGKYELVAHCDGKQIGHSYPLTVEIK